MLSRCIHYSMISDAQPFAATLSRVQARSTCCGAGSPNNSNEARGIADSSPEPRWLVTISCTVVVFGRNKKTATANVELDQKCFKREPLNARMHPV